MDLDIFALYNAVLFPIVVFFYKVSDLYYGNYLERKVRREHPQIKPSCIEINNLHSAYKILYESNFKDRKEIKQAYKKRCDGILSTVPPEFKKIVNGYQWRRLGEKSDIIHTKDVEDFISEIKCAIPYVEALLNDTGRTLEDIRNPKVYKELVQIKAGTFNPGS